MLINVVKLRHIQSSLEAAEIRARRVEAWMRVVLPDRTRVSPDTGSARRRDLTGSCLFWPFNSLIHSVGTITYGFRLAGRHINRTT